MVTVVATATTPPVTTPVVKPTVATPVLLLVQVPVPASKRVVVRPEHTVFVPVMPDGKELTVSIAVAAQEPIV